MSALSTESRGTISREGRGPRRFWLALVILTLILPALVRFSPTDLGTFPEAWNFGIREPLDDFQFWVTLNRQEIPAFIWFFNPLKDGINAWVKGLEKALIGTPWFVIVGAVFWLGLRARGLGLAVFCAACFVFMGLVDLWQESLETLALMGVSVVIALLLGIPLGILSAQSNRFKALLRPVLDVMQTLPTLVYLIPMTIFFSIARAPSVVATLIYAIAPAIRYTDLGIRQVPKASLEAAKAFGATRWQTLRNVQLPLALPQIVAGINQTIMMAFGMVVIAALIGANGLGKTVLDALRRLEVGRGLEAGLAIALMAIVLDRISRGFAKPRPFKQEKSMPWFRKHFSTLLFLFGFIAAYLIGRRLPIGDFPEAWQFSISGPIDAFVRWSRDSLFLIEVGGVPFGTGPLSDFFVLYLINPLNWFFQAWLVWPLLILTAVYLVIQVSSWQLGLFTFFGLFAIGFLGMWEPMIITLSQVIVGTVLTVVLALSLGIWSARSERVRLGLEPILDMLQTIPSFVYLIPVIMLFNIGYVPGIIASVLYALPPGIRLISLGIQQVNKETLEAATSFGATERQLLRKVQLPLALPSIMLGINQIIMMILAMVVIAGLVGSGGLGLEAVTGLAKNETGRGIESGLAIVFLAMILDRTIQAWAAKQRVA